MRVGVEGDDGPPLDGEITECARLRLGERARPPVRPASRIGRGAVVVEAPGEREVPVEVRAHLAARVLHAVLPPHAAPFLGPELVVLVAVGVQDRHDPDGAMIQQVTALGIPAVALHELLDEVDQRHHAGRLAGVHERDERRLFLVLVGVWIGGQLPRPDGAPLERRPQLPLGAEDAGVGGGEPVHDAQRLVQREVAAEDAGADDRVAAPPGPRDAPLQPLPVEGLEIGVDNALRNPGGEHARVVPCLQDAGPFPRRRPPRA